MEPPITNHDPSASSPERRFSASHDLRTTNSGADATNHVENDDEISILDFLQVVADNLRLLVLGPLVAGLIALGISFLITPTFTATTTFLPPQQPQSAATIMLQSLGALAGAAGASVSNPMSRYVAFIESRPVKDAVIDRVNLMNHLGLKSRERARGALGANTTVSINKNGLMIVAVDDHDPKVAADIANAYVEELNKFLNGLSVTEPQSRRTFFEQQLKKAKESLVAAETALNATGVNESAVKASPVTAVGAVASLMAHVAAKEVEISAMRAYFTENAPDLKRVKTELAALRAQLSRIEMNNPQASRGSDYVSKYRDFKYYETLFELMAKQFEIARIDESREGSIIQVVDVALPPEHKSKPKKALNAVLTTLAAGFALLLFVFVRQAARNVGQDPESAQKIAKLRNSLRGAVKKSKSA